MAEAKEELNKKLQDPTEKDFARLDIRVGKIVEVWKHPESNILYCLKIDIGEESLREIGSGLQKQIPIEQISGLVSVLSNLRPRKLGGFQSNGMIFAVSSDDVFDENTKVELLRPPENSKVGERIVLENYEMSQEKEKQLNSKKKEFEKVIPHIKTDKECFATFKGFISIKINSDSKNYNQIQGMKLKTSDGYVKCSQLADAIIS